MGNIVVTINTYFCHNEILGQYQISAKIFYYDEIYLQILFNNLKTTELYFFQKTLAFFT